MTSPAPIYNEVFPRSRSPVCFYQFPSGKKHLHKGDGRLLLHYCFRWVVIMSFRKFSSVFYSVVLRRQLYPPVSSRRHIHFSVRFFAARPIPVRVLFLRRCSIRFRLHARLFPGFGFHISPLQ